MDGWRIFSVGGGVPRDLTDSFVENLRLMDKGGRVKGVFCPGSIWISD